jgi:hypothetical protein
MTFSFDADAALAEVRNRPCTPATVAIPATVSAPKPKTVATVATVAAPDPDIFDERAAIQEFDGGLSRADAEDAAAQAQGFADAAVLRRIAAALAQVRDDFAAMDDPTDPRAWP